MDGIVYTKIIILSRILSTLFHYALLLGATGKHTRAVDQILF